MQAVYRDTEIISFPRTSLEGVSSRVFNAPNAEPVCEVVYFVDGEQKVREEISALLAELGMKVVTFASAAEYLSYKRRDTAACVILNIQLPDLSGLELQRQLGKKANPPVIFISDQCDIASTVCAMKAGAIEFLTKPFDSPALIAAIWTAFAQDRRLRQRRTELANLQERYSRLTPREREVLPLIVGGLLNKQAACMLGISEVTLQIHRSQVMRKMQADSFAELVRIAVKLRIQYWRESLPL
jgi:FixJ family two-component response regulator